MASSQFVPLDIPAGVVKTRSGEGAMGRWNDANNVRFKAGKPQKRAGFEQHNDTAMVGYARGMEAWNDVQGSPLYAVGTNLKLYGSTTGEDVTDITPLRFQQEWVDKLSTTINLGAVSVRMTAHGFSLGKDFLLYGNSWQGGSAVGGIVLNASGASEAWEIVEATDADNFKLFPIDDTGTLGNDPFAVVNLSAVVTVTDTAHGRATGDAVWIAGSAAVGGITPAGDYQITKINDNSYTITHGSAATSTTSGGGAAVTYHYGSVATSTVALGGGTVPYYVYLTNPFDTTNLSAVVTVNHTAHGAKKNDYIHISGATAVGGITLDGEYQVTTVVGANSYTITHSASATSTATGGGTAVLIEYEISVGPATLVTESRGYGEGPYGEGFYGATEPADDPTYFDPRTWAIDKNGEDAVASPLGGAVYYWDSSAAGRADKIPNAPTGLRYVFQTEERHLHALGIGGDALLFGWSDQGNLNTWTPADTNTANNSRRVREGSALVAGTPVAGGMNLIWTDTAVYEHQYTGSTFIYDTRLGASNAGLIAAQAFARTPLGVLWMSQNRFKMWNGYTQDVPNSTDVDDWVFGNLDPNQRSKCFAHYDVVNNSVDFYFVPQDGIEPTLYVTVNLDDFSWINGTQTRTTGATFNAGAQNPYRVNGGIVYKHEVGLDADGVAAASTLTLAPYEVAKSYSEMLGIDPDFKRLTGSMSLSVTTYDRNPSDEIETATASISPNTDIADLRAEGRHLSLAFSQTVLGGDWAIDTPQIDVRPSGRRR